MPVSLSSVLHSSLLPEPSAHTASQSGPESPSPQRTPAAVNHGIQVANLDFGPIVGADMFTVETDGSGTTVHFGNGMQGKTPPSGSGGEDVYRTGGGTEGNRSTPDDVFWKASRKICTSIR